MMTVNSTMKIDVSPSTVFFFFVAIVRMILYSYGPSYARYKYQKNTIYRMYNPIYNHL